MWFQTQKRCPCIHVCYYLHQYNHLPPIHAINLQLKEVLYLSLLWIILRTINVHRLWPEVTRWYHSPDLGLWQSLWSWVLSQGHLKVDWRSMSLLKVVLPLIVGYLTSWLLVCDECAKSTARDQQSNCMLSNICRRKTNTAFVFVNLKVDLLFELLPVWNERPIVNSIRGFLAISAPVFLLFIMTCTNGMS